MVGGMFVVVSLALGVEDTPTLPLRQYAAVTWRCVCVWHKLGVSEAVLGAGPVDAVAS